MYTDGGYRATVITPPEIIDRLNEGPTWVAATTDELIGTVSALITPDGLYVRSMAVLPTAQSRGIAGALLRAVEDFARQRGLTRLHLSTTPFLHAAIRVYERAGFHRTPGGPPDLLGTPLFSMTRVLH